MPTNNQAIGIVIGVAVLVIAATVIPAAVIPTAPGYQAVTVEHPEFNPATLLADRPDATGTLDPEVDATGQTVLIDQAHRNQFSEAELNPLLRAFSEAGFTVNFYTGDETFSDELAAADVFVVIAPRNTYTEEQVDRVHQFTDAGGQLVLIGEPTQAEVVTGGLQVAIVETNDRPVALARSYGINYRSKYIYNLVEYAGVFRNPVAMSAGESVLTDDADRIVGYTATQVEAPGGQRVFATGPNTHIDGTGTTTERGLVVRSGNVIAIGDRTLFRVDRYTNADNEVFIENLVEYLAQK